MVFECNHLHAAMIYVSYKEVASLKSQCSCTLDYQPYDDLSDDLPRWGITYAVQLLKIVLI
jgi:hypothetical protein